MTLKEFLNLCFNVFESGKMHEKLLNSITPVLCFSHITKNIKHDIDKSYNKPERCFVAALIGGIFTLSDVKELDVYIKNMLTIFGSSNCDKKFEQSMKYMAMHYNMLESDATEKGSDDSEDAQHTDEWLEDKVIYKNSKFYQHFKAHSDTLLTSQKINKPANKFYNILFLITFLKKYLSYLPMWSIFIGDLRHPNATRGNNGRIEQFNRGLKKDALEEYLKIGELGKLKIGRYVDFQGRRTDRICKEIAMKIPTGPIRKNTKKSKVTDDLTQADLQNEKEQWSKKSSRTNRKSKVFLNTENLRRHLEHSSAE